MVISVSAFVWWSQYFPIVPTACNNAMLGSISNMSEVTTTGGETVTTGCGALKTLPMTRRDYSCVGKLFMFHFKFSLELYKYKELGLHRTLRLLGT